MSVHHEICNHLKVSKSSSFYDFSLRIFMFGHLLFRAFPATANLEAQPQELYLGVARLRERLVVCRRERFGAAGVSLYSLYFPMKWESKELRIDFVNHTIGLSWFMYLYMYVICLLIVHLYPQPWTAKKDMHIQKNKILKHGLVIVKSYIIYHISNIWLVMIQYLDPI